MQLDDFRAAARWFLAEHARHTPRDYGAIMPPERRDAGVAWQRRLFDHGWAGIHWPTDHGGRGLSAEHQSVWIEECARVDVPPFVNMVGVVLAGQGIQRFGTPAQQAEHLRPILTAERVWCQLFSEPDAGSDLAALRTTADADGDGFVVTGHKVWCSGGRISDWGILLARTDRSLPKHRGISFFLLDMRTEGVEVRPLRQITGGAEFDEVVLDEVRLPADSLLGPLHEGWAVAMATLTDERGSIGAAQIAMQRRLDSVVDALVVTGGGRDPVARDAVAGLVSRGGALLALACRQGPDASVASSLGKLATTEMGFDVAMRRAELAGAEATLWNDVARAVVAAPGGRIAGGTSQIQRTIIGERLLGLPKEPRSAT